VLWLCSEVGGRTQYRLLCKDAGGDTEQTMLHETVPTWVVDVTVQVLVVLPQSMGSYISVKNYVHWHQFISVMYSISFFCYPQLGLLNIS